LKPKLVIVLVLIVVSPLAVILWLGARVVRDEQFAVERRIEQLVIGELEGVVAEIARSVSEYRRAVLEEMTPLTEDRDALRRLTRESQYVRQYFVVGGDGRLLHPPVGDPREITREELRAIDRTQRIWLGGGLLSDAAASEDPSRSGSVGRTADTGWHTGYWDDGPQLILWRRDGDRLHAAEINPIRFLSDIVAELPDTAPGGEAIPEWRIRLAGASGKTLYQWGSWEPTEGARPAFEMALDAPLTAWRLEYFASDEALGTVMAGSVALNAIIASLVLVSAVMGLTYYLYREQSREMREAAQRVSFVNQVSHELKTPLTNIRMYAEMMEQDLADSEGTSRRHLDVIVSESQRLSRLIGNILTFSRKQRHALTLHRKPGVVDDVLRGTLDHFTPALQAKSVEVELTPGAGETVLLDADAIEQIVGNLISNVEKYASSGRRLKITSDQQGDQVTILVSDNGPGIPRSQREKIFDPFYRVSSSLTEGVSGSGIGLSVARELARLHGGELVLVPSERGSSFRIKLHCARPGREEGA
jgi:signal transduction histidine kinase